jgi:hypothetical protein
VISKKKKLYRFSGRFRAFYRGKPLREKKFRCSAVWHDFTAVEMKNFVRPHFQKYFLKDAFKLETSPLGSLKELV